MSPFEVVQAIQSAAVDVVGCDLRRDNISFRCVSQRIDTFRGSHEGKVKRHPVTSATGVRVRIADERVGPPPSSIHTYKQSWISTTTTTTPLGNAPETYHRCFANVNGPQYYYFSSQIKPDDIDSCGLYCLYAGWWWWWWISTIAYMYVLMMAAAPHVHRQYGRVRPWRKSLGGVSLSPRGIRRMCRFAGKRTGNLYCQALSYLYHRMYYT
jgi:hypothetical protein